MRLFTHQEHPLNVFYSDPNVFPDFDVFRPERFLDESGKNEIAPPDTHNMGHVTYGFGRRYVFIHAFC